MDSDAQLVWRSRIRKILHGRLTRLGFPPDQTRRPHTSSITIAQFYSRVDGAEERQSADGLLATRTTRQGDLRQSSQAVFRPATFRGLEPGFQLEFASLIRWSVGRAAGPSRAHVDQAALFTGVNLAFVKTIPRTLVTRTQVVTLIDLTTLIGLSSPRRDS